ncbi:hypothetical protein EVA_10133 [gut metagenome]|uniref:Uncharacterized protein n=1 Tax=gut metagenome TaxID=749906 RepID=J9GP78_9ZZZZ
MFFKASAKITVARRPHLRKQRLINLAISFFLRVRFSSLKLIPSGRISDKSARPTVVS